MLVTIVVHPPDAMLVMRALLPPLAGFKGVLATKELVDRGNDVIALGGKPDVGPTGIEEEENTAVGETVLVSEGVGLSLERVVEEVTERYVMEGCTIRVSVLEKKSDDGDGGFENTGGRSTVEGIRVAVDSINTSLEVIVLMIVVAKPGGSDIVCDGTPVLLGVGIPGPMEPIRPTEPNKYNEETAVAGREI